MCENVGANKFINFEKARKLQATLVRNYDLLADGGEV